MSDELDRIKKKIEKLLRLAEQSANEHEAANAMAKARKLMDEYQLTRLDIKGTGEHQQQFTEAQVTRVFANLPKYMDILSVAVARFNDCQSIARGGEKTFKANTKTWGKYLEFRGLKEDVEIAAGMYATLLGAINRLCKEYLESVGYEGKYPVGIGNEFKYGCAQRLCHRLTTLREEREAEYAKTESTTGTSLVVVKNQLVEQHYGVANYSTVKKKAAVSDEALDAYLSGIAAGDRVQIQKQIRD